MNTTLVRKGAHINGITLTQGAVSGPSSVKTGAECAARGHNWISGMVNSKPGVKCSRCSSTAV